MNDLPSGWYRDPAAPLGHLFWDGDSWFQLASDGRLRATATTTAAA